MCAVEQKLLFVERKMNAMTEKEEMAQIRPEALEISPNFFSGQVPEIKVPSGMTICNKAYLAPLWLHGTHSKTITLYTCTTAPGDQ